MDLEYLKYGQRAISLLKIQASVRMQKKIKRSQQSHQNTVVLSILYLIAIIAHNSEILSSQEVKVRALIVMMQLRL